MLFLLVIFAVPAYAQIPVKGFGKITEIKIDKGYDRLFSYRNTPSGSYSLFGINSAAKGILLYKNSYANPDYKKLPSFVSDASSFPLKTGETGYYFVSRTYKTISYITQDKSDNFIRKAELKLTTSPDVVSAAVIIPGSGFYSALVSGPGFNGVSIFYFSGDRIIRNSITENTAYSSAEFIDLNKDSYPDFVAFDLSANFLSFYYNERNGTFTNKRSIKFSKPVEKIKTDDFNGDGFEDIICSGSEGISILTGDFEGTYKNRITLSTVTFPKDFIAADLNNDKLTDLAWLDTFTGLVKVAYRKSLNTFHEEMTLSTRQGNASIEYDEKLRTLFVININGQLTGFSTADKNDRLFDFATGSNPEFVTSVDIGFDGIKDFVAVDNLNKTLGIIINDRNYIPRVITNFTLLNTYNRIYPVEIDKYNKYFILYNMGGQLLNLLQFNGSSSLFTRKFIYTEGNIIDVKAEIKDNKPLVAVLHSNGKKTSLSVFSTDNKKVSEKKYDLFNSRVNSGQIDHDFNVYYTVFNQNDYSVFFYEFSGGKTKKTFSGNGAHGSDVSDFLLSSAKNQTGGYISFFPKLSLVLLTEKTETKKIPTDWYTATLFQNLRFKPYYTLSDFNYFNLNFFSGSEKLLYTLQFYTTGIVAGSQSLNINNNTDSFTFASSPEGGKVYCAVNSFIEGITIKR